MAKVFKGRKDRSKYTFEDRSYDSVTHIIQACKKDFSDFQAMEIARQVRDHVEAGRAQDLRSISRVKGFATAKRDAAGRRGSIVHEILEDYSANKPVNILKIDEVVLPYAQSLLAWLAEHRPVIHMSEFTVFSDTYGYAGTADMALEIPSLAVPIPISIGDLKTSKDSYPEHALQMAAYKHGDYIVDATGARKSIPSTSDSGYVLNVTPQGCRLLEWDCGEETFQKFVSIKRVFDWKKSEPRYTTVDLTVGEITREVA